MRRKIAIGTLGFAVLLTAAAVTWAEEGAPEAGGPGQGQHQMGGGQHQWGNGPHQFADGQRRGFGGPGGRGMGGRRMGGGEFGGGMHLLRMAENPRVRTALGLTDEQVARFHKLSVDMEKVFRSVARICNCATLNSANC